MSNLQGNPCLNVGQEETSTAHSNVSKPETAWSKNSQTGGPTAWSLSAGGEESSAPMIGSASLRDFSIESSRAGREGGPNKNPQARPKWKVWSGSPSKRPLKCKEMSGAALAREKGVSKNILYHEMQKAKRKNAKFILLRVHSNGDIKDVKYTAELATGFEEADGYHECSIPMNNPKKSRFKRISIPLAPNTSASDVRLPTTLNDTISSPESESITSSIGGHAQPKDGSDRHLQNQTQSKMTKRFYPWADRWIVFVPGLGTEDETISSIELSSRTDVSVDVIHGHKRSSKTGKHFSEVELSFYANGNKADVRIQATINLAVKEADQCRRVWIPLGQHFACKAGSSPLEPGGTVTNSTLHLSLITSQSNRASRYSISVDLTEDSTVNEFSDLFAEADRADKMGNKLGGGEHLWPECFSIRRVDLTLDTAIAKQAVSHIIIGFKTLWESLSVEEQQAFGKMGKQSLRTVLGAGATDACVRHIGQTTVTIERLSCCQFVSKGREQGMKPEQIIGELKLCSEENKMGVCSWICYRYGVSDRDGTDLGGFAIGTGSLFRSTGVRPQLIQQELSQDSTEGVFMNPEQVQWRIRRVGWAPQGTVPGREV